MLSFQSGEKRVEELHQTQKGSRKRESKFISDPSNKDKEEVTYAQGFLSDRHFSTSKDTTTTAVTISTNKGVKQMKGIDPLSKLQITVCTYTIFVS
jgi:hypothetical protein